MDAPTPVAPYEILPPPIFAFEPSLFHWLVLLILCLALLALWRLQSNRRTPADSAALSEFSSELRRIASQAQTTGCSEEVIERVSLRLRRLLSALLRRPIDALSLSEIEEVTQQTAKDPLGHLLVKLCELERLRYAPTPTLQSAYLQSLADSLDAISERGLK